MDATGDNSAKLTFTEDIYQNADCSGAIVGSFRLPQPVTATFQNRTIANFPPAAIVPDADTVDRVTISTPAMTAQLTGSGVSGSCVNYPGGEVCYGSLSSPASTDIGAAYLTGNYFITFSLINGVLEADGVYSKDASFNLNMLTLDNSGGGSDGTVGSGGDGTGSTAQNPLAKYAGTYYICNGNTKETVTVVASDANSAKLTFTEDIYQNADCSGAIVGSFRLPQPVTATFQNRTTANFPPVTIVPDADTVDRVTISTPAMTAQLTGSGVSGSCVNYPGGEVCYDSLSSPASTDTGAAYLTGNYFITFGLINGVLEADGVYSKDASFNLNMLAPD